MKLFTLSIKSIAQVFPKITLKVYLIMIFVT